MGKYDSLRQGPRQKTVFSLFDLVGSVLSAPVQAARLVARDFARGSRVALQRPVPVLAAPRRPAWRSAAARHHYDYT